MHIVRVLTTFLLLASILQDVLLDNDEHHNFLGSSSSNEGFFIKRSLRTPCGVELHINIPSCKNRKANKSPSTSKAGNSKSTSLTLGIPSIVLHNPGCFFDQRADTTTSSHPATKTSPTTTQKPPITAVWYAPKKPQMKSLQGLEISFKPFEERLLSALLDSAQRSTGLRLNSTNVAFKSYGSELHQVYGGEEAARGQFPYLASLHVEEGNGRTKHHCSGALIAPKWVLTAADCYCLQSNNCQPDAAKLQKTWVVLGEHDTELFEPDEQWIRVRRAVFPNARTGSVNEFFINADIVLLELVQGAYLNKVVQTINLPTSENQKPAKNTAVEPGWGVANGKRDTAVSLRMLRWTTKRVLEQKYAQRQWAFVNEAHVCADSKGVAKTSCKGYPGAPLVCNGVGQSLRDYHKRGRRDPNSQSKYSTSATYICGVVNGGPTQCGSPDEPSLYASVAHHLEWIRSVTKQ